MTRAPQPDTKPVATLDVAVASQSLQDLLHSVQADAFRVALALIDGGAGKNAKARLRESLREAAFRVQEIETFLEHTFVAAHLGSMEEAAEVLWMQELRRCRECGCTEGDCSGCVERTGEPCSWTQWDLCSACATS